MHRDEVARTEQRLRIEQLEEKAVEELGLDPRRWPRSRPPAMVPVPAPSDDEEPGTAAVRARGAGEPVARAERALDLLGRVNPLALEEFAALEERHAFLSGQLRT